MRQRMTGWVLTGFVLAVSAGVAVGQESQVDPKLKEAEKAIVDAWKDVKSAKADVTMEMNMDQGGMVMKGEGKGTFEYESKGDKGMFRMEYVNNMTMTMGENEQKMEQTQTMVSDGEYAYTLSEQMGQKTAYKTKADDSQLNPDARKMFEKLREENTLKLLGDEKVDGKDAYVIEATPREGGPMGAGKTVMYFSKDKGMLVKMVTHMPDGKPMMTMTYRNVQYDADIPDERFKFEAPEGVTVIDQTGADQP